MNTILTVQQISDIQEYLTNKYGGINVDLQNLLVQGGGKEVKDTFIINAPINLSLSGKYLDCQADMYLLLRSKGIISKEDAEKAKAILFDIYFPSVKDFIRTLMKNMEYYRCFSSKTKYGIPGDGCFYIVWETFNSVIRKINLLKSKTTHSVFVEVWKTTTMNEIANIYNRSQFQFKIADVYIEEFNKIRKYARSKNTELSKLEYQAVRTELKLHMSEKVFTDYISGRLDVVSFEKIIEKQSPKEISELQKVSGTKNLETSSGDFLYKSLLSLLCDPTTSFQQARDLVVVFDTIIENNMDKQEYEKMVKLFSKEHLYKSSFVQNARNRGCELIMKYAQEHYPEEFETEKACRKK